MKNTLKKGNIDNLFKNGKWINTLSIKAIYLPSTKFEYMVSAPIKKFRKAVDRNKIKRLLRQNIKISKPISIAFIYNSSIIENSNSIRNDMKHILKIINSAI